jgi:hypothetical protein
LTAQQPQFRPNNAVILSGGEPIGIVSSQDFPEPQSKDLPCVKIKSKRSQESSFPQSQSSFIE